MSTAIPTLADAREALFALQRYHREAAAYRAGLLDDPMPNPCVHEGGGYGVRVSRRDYAGREVVTFVPHAMLCNPRSIV